MSKLLTVFENNVIPNANLRQSRFKFFFTIVNQQPAPRDGFAEITDSKIQQTNVYDGVYFNDFIKLNLAKLNIGGTNLTNVQHANIGNQSKIY